MPCGKEGFFVTPNGLGDNGYDDDAANGLFAFMKERGVPIRLLMPKDIAEAEKLYRQWITKNASRDSSVLVVGSILLVAILCVDNIDHFDERDFDNLFCGGAQNEP